MFYAMKQTGTVSHSEKFGWRYLNIKHSTSYHENFHQVDGFLSKHPNTRSKEEPIQHNNADHKIQTKLKNVERIWSTEIADEGPNCHSRGEP